MDSFLSALKGVFDSLGATIALPIIIFFIAIILGAKPGKAFRAGVVVGIAFIGINLVIGLMWGALSGVGQALVTNLGLQKDIVVAVFCVLPDCRAPPQAGLFEETHRSNIRLL